MQIAHVILAHKSPDQLNRLVGKLVHPCCSVYVHLDARIDIDPFRRTINHPNVYFISKRIKVNWGGFSQVRAFLNSITECLSLNPQLGYFNFLSGQDYPLKSMSQFESYLSSTQGSAFMEFVTEGDLWLQEAGKRVSQYHLTDLNFFGRYTLEKAVNKILPRRRLPDNFKLVGRSQWFTMDRECAEYILDVVARKKDLVRCFKHSWGADELFFQSIIYNSHLKYKLVNNNLRYIDWSRKEASPKVLTTDDIDKLSCSDKFFARKFDSKIDEHVLDYIDKNLLS